MYIARAVIIFAMPELSFHKVFDLLGRLPGNRYLFSLATLSNSNCKSGELMPDNHFTVSILYLSIAI